jgi:hypothetical protein
VQGLTETEIKCYADIERLLRVGDLVSLRYTFKLPY